jgi:hypothetical protein
VNTATQQALVELRDAFADASDKLKAVQRFIALGQLPPGLDFPPLHPGTFASPSRAMFWFELCDRVLAGDPTVVGAVGPVEKAPDAPKSRRPFAEPDARLERALDRAPVSSRLGKGAAAAMRGRPEK